MLVLLAPQLARADDAVTLHLVYEESPNPPRDLGTGAQVPDPPGITIDMLRLVAQRLGIDLELLRVPWQRGLFMVQTGQADGIFHASFRKERMAIGVYPMKGDQPDESRAIFFQKYVFYVRAGSGVTWDGTTIRGLTQPIGATTGYAIAADLTAKGLPVETERNQLMNFRKLQEGRIDAYAELQTMADPYLAANGGPIDGIVRLDPAIVEKAYYLLLSHQFYAAHPELAEAIWDGIAAINNSDDIDNISARYRAGD